MMFNISSTAELKNPVATRGPGETILIAVISVARARDCHESIDSCIS